MSHTPGPWFIAGSLRIMAKTPDHAVANIIPHYSLLSTYKKSDLTNETKANAQLIAAAPELLEAARALIAQTNTPQFSAILEAANWSDDDTFYNLLLACNKAEGSPTAA